MHAAPLVSAVGRRTDLVPALLFVAWVTLLGAWWATYEIDTDEGLNLIKAQLLLAGHDLYSETWSDQPPLLTWALAGVLRFSGNSIAAARGLSLLCAAVLLWSLFRIVRRIDGSRTAWTVTALVGLSALYLRLGVTVMVGLPAVMLALLALDQLLAWRHDPRPWRVALSGALFGLSLQTKLFTAILVPTLLFVAILAQIERRGERRGLGREVTCGLLWLAAAAFTFGAVLWLAGEPLIEQLLSPHVGARAHEAFEHKHLWLAVRQALRGEMQFVVLLPAALLAVWRQRHSWTTWIPVVWAASAVASLAAHRPVWWHHVLLVLLPLGWLAGRAGTRLCRAVAAGPVRGRLRFAGVVFVALVAVLSVSLSQRRAMEKIRRLPSESDRLVQGRVAEWREATHWLFTDRPIDAFYSGLPVPPPLAVLSKKRMESGTLSASAIVDCLSRYRPEQAIFRRFRPWPGVLRFLEERYVRVHESERYVHWVRRDIVDPPVAAELTGPKVAASRGAR